MKQANPVAVEGLIFTIRGQKVLLDADLADVYGVTTSRFNEAFKRNRKRFPEDFAFQLTTEEFTNLRSQIATSSLQHIDKTGDSINSSQFAISSSQHRGKTYRPWAFTEHGALMAANILRSEQAVHMSIYVVRAFVKQREQVEANAAIFKRLAEIDKSLLQHDSALRDIYRKLLPLLQPEPEQRKRGIGFVIDDK
ncbi:MAG: ORF6N domain-containing protein [Pseudomonadales bacterium]